MTPAARQRFLIVISQYFVYFYLGRNMFFYSHYVVTMPMIYFQKNQNYHCYNTQNGQGKRAHNYSLQQNHLVYPAIVNAGRPEAICTSTSISRTSIPRNATVLIRATMCLMYMDFTAQPRRLCSIRENLRTNLSRINFKFSSIFHRFPRHSKDFHRDESIILLRLYYDKVLQAVAILMHSDPTLRIRRMQYRHLQLRFALFST